METEMELDDAPTRQSSKFSLGSSLSVLSADEQLDGEGPLTPTDKIQDGEDDDMSDLNSLIDSTGTLSNAEVTDDEDMLLDNHSEHDSASPLSSIPDDFPLSRSASPEINEQETSEPLQDEQAVLKENEAADSKNIKSQVEEDDEEEEEEEEEEPVGTTSTRGRRKEAITRQQKLKQQEQKTNNNRMVKSAAKDKENEKEAGSRRKRTKRESPIDKAEESKAKKQRTSEPKSRKGLNKQRKEKEIEQEDDDQDEGEEDGFDQEKKEETKIEENGEADQQEKAEKETSAESSNDGTDNNNNNDQDENKENIEQNDPEIKVDPQGDGDDDEARHREALEALTHIEIEFARLRDKMYQEKMTELNEEAMRVANGTHPDLVASIAEIEEKKTKRISSAEAWREHQYDNFKKQFEGFEYQANVHFITQKNALRRKVLSGLNDKKWRIEDEHTKNNDSISTEQYPDRQQMVAHKQKQKDEMTELRDIRQTVGFPMAPVPTGLCTEDIDEDFRKFGIEHHL